MLLPLREGAVMGEAAAQLPREAAMPAVAPLQPRGQAVAVEARVVLQALAAALLLVPRAFAMVPCMATSAC